MIEKLERMFRRTDRFWLILAVCALSFLVVVGIGLLIFWDFMAAYEISRPKNAIESFMADVTPAYISQIEDVLPEGIDYALQSEEEARKVIADSLGSISYAKNTKLSTEEKMVYMVLNSGKPVGQVAMTVVRSDGFGFDYWEVTEQTYDFSYLLCQPMDITVPEEFLVHANGVQLGESYITARDVQFESLEEYYAKYDLPTLCTYGVGPVMGELSLTVTDPAGEPVEITAETDMKQFLKNCTDEEVEALQDFLTKFVQRYTDFTSVTGGQGKMQRNYNQLVALISGNTLAQRMKEAMVGLIWVTDRNASVEEITLNMCLRLEEGRYLCDFTYVVDTNDFSGSVESTSRVEMVGVETKYGLKAESMVSK